jgi:hypothetical protein
MLLRGSETVDRIYRSRFRDWDTRSAVRAKPLPAFPAGETADKLFFTPELVPAATHPLVRDRGEHVVRAALTYHLFGHLDFTDALENEIVTPVAYMMGRRQFDFSLPPSMLVDARKIAVDEMHHALFAAGFVQDIASASGVPPLPTRRPAFLLALDDMKAAQDRAVIPLMMLFFAVVSETLITGTLSMVPNDARVIPGVRTILRDHAEDEARHHVYFAEVLTRCWPQLTQAQRAAVGPLLPRFIMLFLSPDVLEIQRWLGGIGLSAGEAERVIDEGYAPACEAAAIRSGAEATLRLMTRAGVLDDALTADAFHAVGLA